VNAGGAAHMTVRETLRGNGAIGWRGQLDAMPPAELEHRFEEEYAARLVPGARLRSLHISGRKRDDEALVLEYELEIASLGRAVDGGWALPPMLTSELAASYARLDQRTTTLLISNPAEVHVVVKAHGLGAAKLTALPSAVTLRAPVGTAGFVLQAKREDDAVVIDRRLSIPITRVPTDKYGAFAAFCRAVDAAEDRELVLPNP
jgi:hypothetical protein